MGQRRRLYALISALVYSLRAPSTVITHSQSTVSLAGGRYLISDGRVRAESRQPKIILLNWVGNCHAPIRKSQEKPRKSDLLELLVVEAWGSGVARVRFGGSSSGDRVGIGGWSSGGCVVFGSWSLGGRVGIGVWSLGSRVRVRG